MQEPMIPKKKRTMRINGSGSGGTILCIAISAFLFIAVILVVSYAFLGNHVSKEAKETFQMLKKCLNDTNLSTNVVELVIPDGTCNDVDKTVFDLGAFNRLRRFYVGSFSLGSIRTVKICNLNGIQKIVFKEGSFMRENGELHIENCRFMRELTIQDKAFSAFTRLYLTKLPALKSLEIGAGCFTDAQDFALADFDSLQSVVVGENSFAHTLGSFLLVTSSVQDLRIRDGAFAACDSLHLIALPSLKNVEIGSRCFVTAEQFHVDGMPALKSLTIGASSFVGDGGKFSLTNCDAMADLSIGDGAMSGFVSLDLDGTLYLKNVAFGAECFQKVQQVDLSHRAELKTLTIGNDTFLEAKALVLEGVESLQELDIGRFAFQHATRFEITRAVSLRRLTLKEGSFRNTTIVNLSDMPALQSVWVGPDCFSAAEGSFTVSSCKSLTTLTTEAGSFKHFKRFQLEKLPALETQCGQQRLPERRRTDAGEHESTEGSDLRPSELQRRKRRRGAGCLLPRAVGPVV